MQNAKKPYKGLTIFFIIIFILSFSFSIVGCGKKKNESNAIPQSNVFQDLLEFMKSSPTIADHKDYRHYFFDIQNSPKVKEAYSISYKPDNSQYLFFNFIYETDNASYDFEIKFLIKEEQNYSQNEKICFVLEQNSETSYQAALMFPAVQYIGPQTTLSLPEFTATNPQNMSEEIKNNLRSKVANILNKLLSKTNKFYEEKIKGGDKRFNEYFYKYFYLPVKITT